MGLSTDALKLLGEYGVVEGDFFITADGNVVVRRQGIDKIEEKLDGYLITSVAGCGKDYAVVVCDYSDGKTIKMSKTASAVHGDFGYVLDSNGKEELKLQGTTTSWYVVETAEYRARARVVLTYIGAYKMNVFSEDESEGFESAADTKKKKGDSIVAAALKK